MTYTILESEYLYGQLDEASRRVSGHREALNNPDLPSVGENFHSKQLRLDVGKQIELSDQARAAQIVEFGSKRIAPHFFEAFLEIFESCGRDFSKAREIFEGLIAGADVRGDELFESR